MDGNGVSRRSRINAPARTQTIIGKGEDDSLAGLHLRIRHHRDIQYDGANINIIGEAQNTAGGVITRARGRARRNRVILHIGGGAGQLQPHLCHRRRRVNQEGLGDIHANLQRVGAGSLAHSRRQSGRRRDRGKRYQIVIGGNRYRMRAPSRHKRIENAVGTQRSQIIRIRRERNRYQLINLGGGVVGGINRQILARLTRGKGHRLPKLLLSTRRGIRKGERAR